MMKKATTLIFGMVLLLLLGSGQVLGQIHAPEGLNMPGTWNGYTNPSTNNLYLASSTQVEGGKITKIDIGTTRWITSFQAGSDKDVPVGTFNWLFTSGPADNAYNNKWAGVIVSMNSVQTYTHNKGADNSITLIDGNWYTVIWKDNGYQDTQAIFMETSSEPVDIVSIETGSISEGNFTVEVELSDAASTEERFYVRYTADGWASSQHILLTGTGTSLTASIPAVNNTNYYILSTTVDLGTNNSTYGGDYDLVTIKMNNNGGSNYDFIESGFELTENPGFRLLSSPVAGTTLETLLKDNNIFTQCFEGATDNSGICKPYGEATEEGDVTENVFFYEGNSWLPVNNITNSIAPGTGIIAYIFTEDIGESITVSGNENSGDISPALNPNNDGWTLVGNPYASTIDFKNVTKTGLTDVVYVWDPNSIEWKSYVQQGELGELAGGLIAPFQGFFVQTAEEGTPSLTFNSAAKSSGGTFYGKQITSDPQFVRLQVEGNGLSNSAWLQFSEQGSDVEQVRGDAVELESLSPQFAQLAFQKNDQNLLDIAHLPVQDGNYEIPVQFTATTNGAYKLSATHFEIPAGLELTFHDYQENVNVAITEDFTYTFELNTAAKVAEVPPLKRLQQGPLMAKAADSQRFGISLKAKTGVSNEPGMGIPQDFALEQNYPNPFNPSTVIRYQVAVNSAVTLKVYDVMGREISTLVDGRVPAGSHQVMFDAAALSSGIYYYRLQSAGQVLTRQMTLIK